MSKSSEQEFNEKWNLHEIVKEAVRTSHPETSPESRTRFNKLESNMEVLLYQMKEMQKNVESIVIKIEDKVLFRSEFEDKIDAVTARVDRLEKLLYGAIGLALLSLGKALLELVIK